MKKNMNKISGKIVTNENIFQGTLKFTDKIIDVLESDEPIPQVNAKLQAAQTLLDRVGVSKVDRVDINHNVQSGGIFLMPDKKPLDLDDGDYEELSE